jgi:hypothetical protein
MFMTLHVKQALFLSDCNETCIFSTDNRKMLAYNSQKSVPVGAELFHADGHGEANLRFS